ncbi:MAG: lipopolysaccharide biosynthesis protein [Pseudorhodoplanes sp.]|nr:lipopolysaccharide biosynthesis protein [Pseudorhodoplanes sp.]
MAEAVAQNGDGQLDLKALGHALWRKKYRVIVPTLIAFVVSLVGVNLVTPRYKSEARLLVEGRENAFLRPDAERQTTSNLDPRTLVDLEALVSQGQIMQSREVALQVIKQLNLAENPEFDPARRGVSVLSVLTSLFGFGRDALQLTPEERVLDAFYKRLSILPIDKSRVILVEFESTDPELSARVVNAIVDAYFNIQRQNKQEQNRVASRWLASEIDKLRPKVAEAEQNVENFRAKSNLFVGTNNVNLATQQLTDLTGQLAAARAQKADLDAKAKLIRDMLASGKPVETGDITNSELMRRLVEQQVTLRAQLAEQSSTLLGQHPRIRELRAQVANLDVQIRGELIKLVRSIENDALIAAARIDTTTAAIDQIKRQIGGLSSQDVELRSLEREAKAQRDLLESYLAKYREATARESLDTAPTDVRVISRASPSNTPSFPKKIPIILIATLGTAFVAISLIVTGELLDAGRSPEGEGRSAVAKRWMLNFRRRRKGVPEPLDAEPVSVSASAVPVEELAAALAGLGEDGRRILMIGSGRNVGTTYTAIGLARALAERGRVVLVDLALNAPNLFVMSTDPGAPGIADVVRGTASFGQIVTRDRFSRVHVVACGDVGADPAAILASPRLVMTIEAFARTYDYLVIDAGAVADVADLAPLAQLAPQAVLVTADPAQADAQAASELLGAAGFAGVTVFVGTPGARTREAQSPAAA